MKLKAFLIFILLPSFASHLLAQEKEIQFTNNENIERGALDINFKVRKIDVEQDSLVMGASKSPALTMIIPEAKLEDVKKAWSKKIRNKTKSKVTEESEIISIQGTLIELVSPDPINVFSSLHQEKEDVKLVSAFEVDSAFVNMDKDAGQYENTKRFLQDFGLEQYRYAVKEQIKAAKKTLKSRESALEKLQKENEKMHTTIKGNELNIINTQNDIKQNLNDQDLKIEEMKNKKELISNRKGDAKKEAEKELKALEKERKKLQNNSKNMNKKIVKYRAEIEETKRNIKLNLSEQDLQKAKVSEQLSKVKSLEEKLISIK